MQRIVVSCFAVAVLVLITLPLQSMAQSQQGLNKRLKGDYAFTMARDCIQTEFGFGSPPTFNLLSPGTTREASLAGMITYNGDGTGTLMYTILQINNTFPSVIQSQTTCNITSYTVNPDNSYTEDLTCSGTIDAGPSASQTFTITGLGNQGQIGRGGQTLLIMDIETNVETITLSASGTRMRICGRSGHAIRVQ